jgi:hypothetical protein
LLRLAFVSLNREQMPDPVLPLGVGFNTWLFGALRRSGLRGPLWQQSH